jgi:hypothetical protein
MSGDLSFIHRFVPGHRTGTAPLLLLHGTGGDENDLMPLGQAIAPGAALLSARGKVLEHGLPRFFRRLAEGVFDEKDVRRRANELADFIVKARQKYQVTAPVRSVIPTAPISQRPYSSFGLMRWPERSCCEQWCRYTTFRRPISPANRY